MRGMDPKFNSMTAAQYEAWVNQRISRMLLRLCMERGLSAYALGRLCGLSDQTIRNLELGRHDRGCLTGTLARICYHLGMELQEFMNEALN